jgi:4-diphosphocytidyl-2-C-methyl-D-erythritol kinase
MTTANVYAKLTLSLRVVGTLPDGYHELAALTVSIGRPRDTLTVDLVPEPGVSLTLVDAEPGVPTGPENLAVRAAAAALDAANVDQGVALTLRKNIAAGAGLGGGSADAAGALVATREALALDLDDATLYNLAISLGADVPFCLAGGAAWIRGKGERLEAVRPIVGLPLLVAVPPFRLATPDVYRAWDELGGPRSTRAVDAPDQVKGLLPELINDLEPAAEHVEPRVREFRERLEAAAGRPALLAGSGSAYVVPIADPTGLPRLAGRVEAEIQSPVLASATVSRGIRLDPS